MVRGRVTCPQKSMHVDADYFSARVRLYYECWHNMIVKSKKT